MDWREREGFFPPTTRMEHDYMWHTLRRISRCARLVKEPNMSKADKDAVWGNLKSAQRDWFWATRNITAKERAYFMSALWANGRH